MRHFVQKSTLFLWVPAFFLTTGTLALAADDLSVVCSPAKTCVASDNQICVDASTGTITSKKTYLGLGDQVTVTVYNKDPFAYQYKLNVAAEEVKDDDISSFLKLWMPSTSKPDVQPDKSSAQNATSTAKNLMAVVQSVKLGNHWSSSTLGRSFRLRRYKNSETKSRSWQIRLLSNLNLTPHSRRSTAI